MPESEIEREARAVELARETGRREAIVDSRLDAHDQRFALINGSIEKHAHNADALRQCIEKLRDDVARIAAALKVNEAVEKDRLTSSDKQISNRMFWAAVASVCAVFLIGAASIIVTVLTHS